MLRVPGVYLEDLCFDAQQAAEKAVKAALIAGEVTFPPVHDLARLLTLLEQSGEEIPPPITAATQLTRFAVTTRYPGFSEQVIDEDYRQAVEVAQQVVSWADDFVTNKQRNRGG